MRISNITGLDSIWILFGFLDSIWILFGFYSDPKMPIIQVTISHFDPWSSENVGAEESGQQHSIVLANCHPLTQQEFPETSISRWNFDSAQKKIQIDQALVLGITQANLATFPTDLVSQWLPSEQWKITNYGFRSLWWSLKQKKYLGQFCV